MLSSELGIREGELVSQLDQHDDEKRSEKVATDMYRDTLYQTQVTYQVGKQSAAFDLSNADKFVALTGGSLTGMPEGMLLPGASFNTGLGLADEDRKSSTSKLASMAAPLSSQHSKTLLKAAEEGEGEDDEEEEDYADDGFENESVTGVPAGGGKTGNSQLAHQLNEGAAAADSDQDLDYEQDAFEQDEDIVRQQSGK